MKTAIVAGTIVATLSFSLPAVAATTTKYQFKGQNASASFYQYDECNSTSAYITAFTSRVKEGPGAPTAQMGADLYYYNYNYCNGTYSEGYGSSPDANFTIDNQLSSASLNGTFVVYDYWSGTTKTASVALTWTGIGSTSNDKYSYTYQTPTYMTRYRSNGTSREAQVTGSINVDGTNLINSSSSYGYLSSSRSGSFERITRR